MPNQNAVLIDIQPASGREIGLAVTELSKRDPYRWAGNQFCIAHYSDMPPIKTELIVQTATAPPELLRFSQRYDRIQVAVGDLTVTDSKRLKRSFSEEHHVRAVLAHFQQRFLLSLRQHRLR